MSNQRKRDESVPEGAWIVLGLGSNLGDREGALAHARTRLGELGFPSARVSTPIETAPVGGPPGQGPYLNQVLAAPEEAIGLSPRTLLDVALRVEAEWGRVRRERWGPRTLDIDLLLYGARVIDEPGLTVPHPRLHERAFVLAGLVELLPGLVHPCLGLTMAALGARVGPCR